MFRATPQPGAAHKNASETDPHFFTAIRTFLQGLQLLPDLRPVANLLTQSESCRQSCLNPDLFSANRVVKCQILGVQEVTSIARQAWQIFQRLAR